MIVDTGPLVAVANRTEPHHLACSRLLTRAAERLAVPALVVAEATFMIGKAGGAEAEAIFLRSLRSSRFSIEPPTTGDLGRAAALVEQYADLGLGGTDAATVALAERLGERVIATLDRRHFTVVRPRHVEAFTVLP